MGIPFDLKLSDSNGLLISNGDFQLTSTLGEMCKQSLAITLNTWKGEWFLDNNLGVPYLQQIIGTARKKDIVDKVLLAQIADNEYVDSIKSYTSSEDRANRYYNATFTVVVGEDTVTTSYSTIPSQEYIYPTPDTDFSVTCDEFLITPYAEKLYYYENTEGLPASTFDTWWNTWNGQEQENSDTNVASLYTTLGRDLTCSGGASLIVGTT